MARVAPPAPRKRPRQGRSRETVRAIREACGRLLAESAPDALTTQRIAEVAGVNIASLYQYFPNKDAVLADYLEHEAVQLAERAGERFAAIDRLSRQSLERTLAAIIELELAQQRSLAAHHPAFFARYPGAITVHAKVEALTLARDNPSWADWFPGFLAQHAPRLREGDLQHLGNLCHGAFQGMLEQVTGSDAARSDDRGLKGEMLYLLLAYLLDEPPDPAACRDYFAAGDDGAPAGAGAETRAESGGP